jgi:hypothetical protein
MEINKEQRLRPQDLKNAKDATCEVESCNHNCFTPVVMIKVVSAILSPNGRETHVPLQTFACAKCGHVNKDFLPDFSS